MYVLFSTLKYIYWTEQDDSVIGADNSKNTCTDSQEKGQDGTQPSNGQPDQNYEDQP